MMVKFKLDEDYCPFFTFSPLQIGVCNGHASTCEAETGKCIDCQHDTTGFHCEVCLDGWYGDPT